MSFHIANLSEADRVLDDHPFAILIGMALDQQYGMEHAFRGGYKLMQRLGTLDPAAIAAMDTDEFKAFCSEPPAIHRFPGSMAEKLQGIARIIDEEYDGDVTTLWNEAKDGKELLKRITALPGFGQQKARIFIALLAKQLNVRPAGWEEVAGDYALDGWRSVADVVDADSLQKVREYKKAMKAQAKPATPNK